jgi:hypothetical protein
MGLCGGKKKDPYTQAQVNQMNNQRINTARQRWNSDVGRYNSSLPNYGKIFGSSINKIQDLGDFSYRDNSLTSIGQKLGTAEANLSSLDSGGYEWDSSGAPSKGDYNVNLLTTSGNTYDSNIFSNSSGNPALNWTGGARIGEAEDIGAFLRPYQERVNANIESLGRAESKRTSKENRYNTFRDDVLRPGVNDLWGNVAGMTIADKEGIPTSIGEESALRGKLSNFLGNDLNDLRGFYNFNLSKSGLNKARNKLIGANGNAGLRQARSNEVSRMDRLEDKYQGYADDYASQLGGYTIADESGMDDLQRLLRTAGREVTGTRSKLLDEYNFDPITGALGDIGLDLADLQQDRRDEQGRIKTDYSMLKGQSSTLASMLRRMGTYDLGGINEARDYVDEGIGEIDNYESLLDFTNISGLKPKFEGYDNTLSDLLTKRSGELDQYETDLSSYGTELSDLDLWEERKMRDISTRLNRHAGKLGMYSGGRVPDIMSAYEGGDSDITSRLGELEDKRDDFETQAANYLNDARGGFFTTGDLDDMQANYDTLYADVQKYGADQASDELTALSEAIRNEEARFAAEQAAKKKQEEEEAARMQQGNSFMYGLGGRALTPAEYANLLSKRRDNETVTTQGLMSSLMS